MKEKNKKLEIYAVIEHLESQVNVLHYSLNALGGKLENITSLPIKKRKHVCAAEKELKKNLKTYMGKRIHTSAERVTDAFETMLAIFDHIQV
jgi:hypothetical protein